MSEELSTIRAVFDRHGLGEVHSVRPLAGGQINRVLEVNGAFVARLRPAEKDGGAFATERVLFRRLRGRLPVPEILAVDGDGRSAPACVVARKLPGEMLVRRWIAATPRERRWYVHQLAELLRALHDERFPACGHFAAGELVAASTWDAHLQSRLERRLEKTRAQPTADRALLNAVEEYWRRHRSALYERPACLVHRDLHFGNLLVAEHRITAVLDFEASLAAPSDYELDQLLRFLRYPGLFVEDELEEHVSPALFDGVWQQLAELYPEPFCLPQFRQRLSIYSLEYDLAALRDCYAGRWSADALRHVTDRVVAALDERLLPIG